MSVLMAIELDLIEQFIDLSLACEVTVDSVRLGMLKLTIVAFLTRSEKAKS